MAAGSPVARLATHQPHGVPVLPDVSLVVGHQRVGGLSPLLTWQASKQVSPTLAVPVHVLPHVGL
jgi:hypothetical protein